MGQGALCFLRSFVRSVRMSPYTLNSSQCEAESDRWLRIIGKLTGEASTPGQLPEEQFRVCRSNEGSGIVLVQRSETPTLGHRAFYISFLF